MSNKWSEISGSQYPFFKDKIRTRRKWSGQKIYTDKKRKYYYHKDPLHGEIEMYNSIGTHIGVLTPEGDPHPKKGKIEGRNIKDLI